MVLAAIACLGLTAWWAGRAGPSAGATKDGRQAADYVLVDLVIEVGEWGGREPTLCEIANRYGLDGDALAATLYDYGGRQDCASPLTRVPRGRRLSIAVTARSPYPHCQALARQPCPSP